MVGVLNMSKMSLRLNPHSQMVLSALIIFGTVLNTFCEGRRMCYNCDTATSGHDCLYRPDNVTVGEPQIPCRHYCTIRREEDINIPGSVSIISLKRGCEEKPMTDGLNVGGFFMTYYRSCRSNLCNDGDGLSSLKDIPEEPDEDYEEEVSSSSRIHYYQTTLRIFKIYFFAFVASIFSIT